MYKLIVIPLAAILSLSVVSANAGKSEHPYGYVVSDGLSVEKFYVYSGKYCKGKRDTVYPGKGDYGRFKDDNSFNTISVANYVITNGNGDRISEYTRPRLCHNVSNGTFVAVRTYKR